MASFLAGLVVTVLLMVGTVFIFDFSQISGVEDANMPGVHVSDQ